MQTQKVNVQIVTAVIEKKTQPMKVVVSSLTTQENANHVNKKIIFNSSTRSFEFLLNRTKMYVHTRRNKNFILDLVY